MNNNNTEDKTKKFLINYIGLSDLSNEEQEEILVLLWNAIHARIFDTLRNHLDEKRLDQLEEEFTEGNEEKVLNEIKEIVPNWDEVSQKSAEEVVEEFKKVRESINSK